MGIKQNIVFKNNFTQKNHKGYGSTPGAFLTDYMVRDGATEQADFKDPKVTVKPRLNKRNEVMNNIYQKGMSVSTADFESHDLNGRVFGNQGLSYDEDQLQNTANHIQELWNEGATVQRMVVSFHYDGEYLKEQGVLRDGVAHNIKGDYRNNVDHLKLRTAITSGMQKLSDVGQYQNPLWAGAIQVNTNDIHCHLIMCDDLDNVKQSNRLRFDNEQRGVFSQRERQAFREGFEQQLNELQNLHPYDADFHADDENKKWYQLNAEIKQDVRKKEMSYNPTYQTSTVTENEKKQDLRVQPAENTNSRVDLGMQQRGLLSQNQRLKKYFKRFKEQCKLVVREAKLYAEKLRGDHTKLNSSLADYYYDDLNDRMDVCDKYRYFFGDVHRLQGSESLKSSNRFEDKFNAWMCGYAKKEDVFTNDVNDLEYHKISREEYMQDYRNQDLVTVHDAGGEIDLGSAVDFARKERLKMQRRNELFDNFNETMLDDDRDFLVDTNDDLINNAVEGQQIVDELQAQQETYDVQEQIDEQNTVDVAVQQIHEDEMEM